MVGGFILERLLRSLFGEIAGSHYWRGPRIRQEMGLATPERHRRFYAIRTSFGRSRRRWIDSR